MNTCQWCGMIHTGSCPRVKATEYYPDGTVKRVEFWDPVTVNIGPIDVDELIGRKGK